MKHFYTYYAEFVETQYGERLMSHYFVHVLVDGIPKEIAGRKMFEKYLQKRVEKLLEPYSERGDVDPYQRRCYCVGQKAKNEGMVQAQSTLNTNWDVLRADFRQGAAKAVLRQRGVKEGAPLTEEDEEAVEAAWERFSQEFRTLVDTKVKAHPRYNQPDPACEDCGGQGTVTSTTNPDGHWDWWVIGGRWTGVVGQVDPGNYPENWEVCKSCFGAQTEYRGDTCKNCQGKGTVLKFPAYLRNEGNVAPVEEIVRYLKAGEPAAPYCFVTPDGQWHSRGKLGPFGMSAGDKPKSEWYRELIEAYEKWPEAVLVGVDAHT